jgi:hypothetical protein
MKSPVKAAASSTTYVTLPSVWPGVWITRRLHRPNVIALPSSMDANDRLPGVPSYG